MDNQENQMQGAGTGVGLSAVLNFGQALSALRLRATEFITRKGWNSHHKLGIQIPDENSANTLPYIYMIVGQDAADMQGKRVPWVCSQTDMLSDDWMFVE